MPTCPECGQPTNHAGRCEACEAVEFALTPRSSPAIEPPPKRPAAMARRPAEPPPPTVTVPLRVEREDTAPPRRIGLWVAAAALAVALAVGGVYAWRLVSAS